MKGQFSKPEIADLLNKFMAGETSLDEENILAQYFRTHEVSDEWKEYKEMFAMFDGGMVEVSLPLSPSKERGTQSRFSSLSRWRGRGVRLCGLIAASIVLLLVFRFTQKPEEGETISRQQLYARLYPSQQERKWREDPSPSFEETVAEIEQSGEQLQLAIAEMQQ